MKLIVNIPEEDYDKICGEKLCAYGAITYIIHRAFRYIKEGIPLDNVIAEMEKKKRFHVGSFESDDPIDYGIVIGFDKAIAMLDNITEEERGEEMNES